MQHSIIIKSSNHMDCPFNPIDFNSYKQALYLNINFCCNYYCKFSHYHVYLLQNFLLFRGLCRAILKLLQFYHQVPCGRIPHPCTTLNILRKRKFLPSYAACIHACTRLRSSVGIRYSSPSENSSKPAKSNQNYPEAFNNPFPTRRSLVSFCKVGTSGGWTDTHPPLSDTRVATSAAPATRITRCQTTR